MKKKKKKKKEKGSGGGPMNVLFVKADTLPKIQGFDDNSRIPEKNHNFPNLSFHRLPMLK